MTFFYIQTGTGLGPSLGGGGPGLGPSPMLLEEGG